MHKLAAETILKILIVSYYFPPIQSVACQRTESFARYLAEFGHEVTVLTHGEVFAQELDPIGYRLIRIPSPLMNWVFERFAFLRKDLAPGEKPVHSTTVFGRLAQRLNRFRAERGLGFLGRMPDLTDAWYFACRSWVRDGTENYDLAISSYAPYSSHLIAGYVKKRGRCKHWVADFRDLWSDHHLFKGLFPFTLAEVWLERRVLGEADLVTTVSEPLAQRLKQRCDKPIEVIYNGYEELSSMQASTPLVPGRLVYTGTLYAEHQDTGPLLRALQVSQADEALENLRLCYAGLSGDSLLVSAAALSGLVDNLGNLNHAQCLSLQRSAQTLLYIDINIPGYDGILPTKLFEYIGSGRPILALTADRDSAACRLLSDVPGAVVLANNTTAILEYLKEPATPLGEGPIVDATGLYSRQTQARQLEHRLLSLND